MRFELSLVFQELTVVFKCSLPGCKRQFSAILTCSKDHLIGIYSWRKNHPFGGKEYMKPVIVFVRLKIVPWVSFCIFLTGKFWMYSKDHFFEETRRTSWHFIVVFVHGLQRSFAGHNQWAHWKKNISGK